MGSGARRAAAGAEPRWRRARACGRASEPRGQLGRGQGRAGRPGCPPQRRRRCPQLGRLAPSGPAVLRSSSRSARSAPPPCTQARGHGEAGTRAGERAELSGSQPAPPATLLPQPSLAPLSSSSPRPCLGQEAPATKEGKRRERRCGKFLWAAQRLGFIHRLGLISSRAYSHSTPNWGLDFGVRVPLNVLFIAP